MNTNVYVSNIYFLHVLSFVKIVPTSNIRKGAYLNCAMGATLRRYATGAV